MIPLTEIPSEYVYLIGGRFNLQSLIFSMCIGIESFFEFSNSRAYISPNGSNNLYKLIDGKITLCLRSITSVMCSYLERIALRNSMRDLCDDKSP